MERTLVVTRPEPKAWIVTLCIGDESVAVVGRFQSAKATWAALPRLKHEHGVWKAIDARPEKIRQNEDWAARKAVGEAHLPVPPQIHIRLHAGQCSIVLTTADGVTVLEKGLSRVEASSRARVYIAAYKARPNLIWHEGAAS